MTAHEVTRTHREHRILFTLDDLAALSGANRDHLSVTSASRYASNDSDFVLRVNLLEELP